MKKYFFAAIYLLQSFILFGQGTAPAANAEAAAGTNGCTAYFYFYQSGLECHEVHFYSIYGGTNVHSWDFGDGNISTEQNPEHVFAAPGTYEVCLTVKDGACDTTECRMVEVVPVNTNTVSGYVFFDVNGDGAKQTGEPGIRNRLVKIGDEVSVYAVTDNDGIYSYLLDTGSYKISTTPPSNWSHTSDDTVDIMFSGCNQSAVADFGMQPFSGLKDLLVFVTPLTPSRPGFDVYYDIDYLNIGSDSVDGTVTLKHDPNLGFLSSTPAVSSYNGGTKTAEWNFTDLAPGEKRKIRVRLNTSSVVTAGSIIETNVSIEEPFSVDAAPENNIDTLFQKVTSSLAYNIKEVYPEGKGPLGLIKNTDKLTYTIHFQNVGIDTAFNVRIIDTLDAGLNFASIEVISSSHQDPVMLTGKDWEITWIYNNIRMPDSSADEPESYGYIKFSAYPDAGLAAGTPIRNKARIYFDFNPPVLTNNTLNTIEGTSGLQIIKENGSNLSVYPNPVVDQLTIHFDNPAGKIHEFVLYDLVGREALKLDIDGSRFILDKNDLVPGVYLFRLTEGLNTVGSGKIIIKE